MRTTTIKQQAVIEAALKELKRVHNINRICVDQILSDEEIDRDGFDEAVGVLILDTCYWEGTFP